MVVCDIHRSGILYGARKSILLRVNKPSEPKNGIWGDWEFFMKQEKIYFWGSKSDNEPSELKTEFGLQHHYGRVVYPSIGNFIGSKKICTFGGQK
jgi:hypothetical protein